ncbi:unnamed protein product [Oikopleura dioica]|uniref:ADP/ATP translocase n=1 Tax=Oikopleura dioica TaxID=34765 RepID=E4XGP9_OIKDI|nr:unnamed protein product [Oikopleura dioica]CBY38612.1 unnamed protein product [Oikopleura dioica]
MSSVSRPEKKEATVLAATSSIATRTIMAPVERVKLILQLQNELIKQGRLIEPYRGFRNCFRRIVSVEGAQSLWRGNMAQVVRCVHTQEINLMFKDRILSLFTINSDTSASRLMLFNIAAGGMAGVLTDCFLYSFDFARTALAADVKDPFTQKRVYENGFKDVLSTVYKSDGIRGLYRGFLVSSVGLFIYRGLYYGLYDSIKPLVLDETSSFGRRFTLAYCVTIFAMQMSYPFDTLRRRMMLTSGTGRHYPSSFHCLKEIIKYEGKSALLVGSTANVLRGTGGALILAGFDHLKTVYLKWKFMIDPGKSQTLSMIHIICWLQSCFL